MATFNDSSTGYSGVLPDDRNEARDDGLLNQYAHMYDVIKEDRYRVHAVSDEATARENADDVLDNKIAAEATTRGKADDNLASRISPLEAKFPITTDDISDGAVTADKIADGVIPSGSDVNIIVPTTVSQKSSVDGNGFAIGPNSYTKDGIVIGNTSRAISDGIAIGTSVELTSGVAIGNHARVSASGCVALGEYSSADEDSTVSVGYTDYIASKDFNRRIVHVGTPTNDNDAATKGYVDTAISPFTSLPDMEWGYTDSFDLGANSTSAITINFSTTKTEAPSVFVMPYCNYSGSVAVHVMVAVVDTSKAVIVVTNTSSDSLHNITLDWLAISGR